MTQGLVSGLPCIRRVQRGRQCAAHLSRPSSLMPNPPSAFPFHARTAAGSHLPKVQALGLLQTVKPHASPQSAFPLHAGTAAGSQLPKPQRLGLRQTVADSVASLVGLTPPGEAGQQSQAEAAASGVSTAAEACIGELAVVPPMLGISQCLLHRDHHKVYYEVGQLCCCLASRRTSRHDATLAQKLDLPVRGWELRHRPCPMSACGACSCPVSQPGLQMATGLR